MSPTPHRFGVWPKMAYDVALRIVGHMTKPVEACCTSPAAMCYWFVVSLMAWAVLSLIGIYWRPLHAPSESACLFAMAIGCLANWLRNRSVHCVVTGPLFLIAGVVFLFSGVGVIHVNTSLVICSFRHRHRVSSGMAIRETFRVIALRMPTEDQAKDSCCKIAHYTNKRE
jgi:hypothetical protein